MGDGTRRCRLVALVGAGVLAGCGSGAAGGSPAASPVPSSTASSGTSGTVPSGEARTRAEAATKKAILPSDAFEKIGLDVEQKPQTRRWDWFETCRPALPSESRQVLGTSGRWSKGGAEVSQTVVAYPDGVAESIVGEVRSTVGSCTEYSASGKHYTDVAAVELKKVNPVDDLHAWCTVREDGRHFCHSVFAAQDLVSSLWTGAGRRDEALEGLQVATQLAALRIDVQIGGGNGPTPSAGRRVSPPAPQ
jgi:hypothetical protein